MRGKSKRINMWQQWELKTSREAVNGQFIHSGIIFVGEKYYVYVEIEDGNATHMDPEADGKEFNTLFDAVEFANNRIEELVNKI